MCRNPLERCHRLRIRWNPYDCWLAGDTEMTFIWLAVAVFTALAMREVHKASRADARLIEDVNYELTMLENRIKYTRVVK